MRYRLVINGIDYYAFVSEDGLEEKTERFEGEKITEANIENERTIIESFFDGNVNSINAGVGDTLKQGTVIAEFDAEGEIIELSMPVDGTVNQLYLFLDQQIRKGDIIAVLK